MNETRKLAAILVADIVGYRRLAGADEDGVLARLRGLRRELIDPQSPPIRAVSSSAPATAGSSSSGARSTRCARDRGDDRRGRSQRRHARGRQIVFRIGIHFGDIIEESDGDLMGDGVNIAARLEGDRQARRDLSFGGRLPAGQGAARDGGQRSRRHAAEKRRRADPGLCAASRGGRAQAKPAAAAATASEVEVPHPYPNTHAFLRWPALAAALVVATDRGGRLTPGTRG